MRPLMLAAIAFISGVFLANAVGLTLMMIRSISSSDSVSSFLLGDAAAVCAAGGLFAAGGFIIEMRRKEP